MADVCDLVKEGLSDERGATDYWKELETAAEEEDLPMLQAMARAFGRQEQTHENALRKIKEEVC